MAPKTGLDRATLGLTAFQVRILQMHADGWRATDICVKLDRSWHTIREHCRKIRRTTRSKTMAEAVAKAMRAGLIE